MVCNLEHVGAPQIVVPTNARETRPETCGALPICVLNTAIPRTSSPLAATHSKLDWSDVDPRPLYLDICGYGQSGRCKAIIEDDARSCSEELLLRLSGWKHGFARAACYRWITPAANLSCADAGACRLDHSGKASIPAASIRHSTNWVSRRAHGFP